VTNRNTQKISASRISRDLLPFLNRSFNGALATWFIYSIPIRPIGMKMNISRIEKKDVGFSGRYPGFTTCGDTKTSVRTTMVVITATGITFVSIP
jgi:hypothetical protein